MDRDERWKIKMRALTAALQKSDVAALRRLTPHMQKHPNVTIFDDDEVERFGAARGVQLDAPPLAVAIERCKAAMDPGEVMKVLVSEWGLDPNLPFTAVVRRTVGLPGSKAAPKPPNCYTIESTPLSWLLYKRYGAHSGKAAQLLSMQALLDCNADPKQLFMFKCTTTSGTPDVIRADYWKASVKNDARYNASSGRSLPSVALEFKLFECVELLLSRGARFLPSDPAPLASAMAPCTWAVDVIELFHRAWRSGAVTTEDATAIAMPGGYTALHYWLENAPEWYPEGRAEAIVDMLLEMGFTFDTTDAGGVTALQCACNCHDVGVPQNHAVSVALAKLRKQRDAHEMAHHALRALAKTLPPELRGEVWQHLNYPKLEGAERASKLTDAAVARFRDCCAI